MARFTKGLLTTIGGLLLAGVAIADTPFVSAVGPDDVEVAATGLIGGPRAGAFPAKAVAALAAPTGPGGWWAARPEPVSVAANMTFHYRLAFTRPVSVGQISIDLDGRTRGDLTLRALRPAAAFPGDPDDAAAWETLPHLRRAERLEVTLLPGFTTRAILLSHLAPPDAFSIIRRWCVLRTRLQNLTPMAVIQGEQAPRGTDPAVLARGGEWLNAGPDDEGRVARHPVSSVEPSWLNLVWDAPQTLVALRLAGNVDTFRLYAFTGGARANPALALAREWRLIRFTALMKTETDRRWATHLVEFPAVATRALRVEILETVPRNRPTASVTDVAAYADLGDEPARVVVPAVQTLPPVGVTYQLTQAGEAALVIDDARGRRVRNLFAQVERTVGPQTEPWDLRDESGQPVAPGTYLWRTICAPPLELHYQFTPYPNVEQHSPLSTPWNRGPQDGWLANHGNPCAVCVVGDRVYMAAGGTEGGHAFLEADYEGAKQWGLSDGLGRLFTDGQTLFGQAGENIKRCDVAARKWMDLATVRPTLDRRGELVGLAAHQGEVTLAFTGKVPYLDNATDTSLVDGEACLPARKAVIKGAGDYGLDLSPLRDFLSLFRLGGHVSGEPRTQVYIETAAGAGRQQHTVLAFRKPVPLGSLVFPRPEEAAALTFRVSVLKPDGAYPPNPRRETDWIDLPLGELGAWNCVAVPPATFTRALRLTFAKPGDELTDALDAAPADAAPAVDDPLAGEAGAVGLTATPKESWQGRIEGMRLLRMRFRSLLPEARVRVNSGAYDPRTAVWRAQRTEALSERNPAILALEWDAPQPVHGVAIKEIDGLRTELDVYVGPASGPIEITAATGWTNVAAYVQKRRNYYQPDSGNNKIARYLDGTVDFGRTWETRAVRLRVVQPWGERSGYPEGVRVDQGGETVDPTRCHIYGVAPLAYLGGEPPVDPLLTRRLAVHDGQNGKLLRESASPFTGAIAFHPSGALYGLQGAVVVRADPAATGGAVPYVTNLGDPRLLTFDAQGRLYVYDHRSDRQVVRVYDEAGRYVRSIGTPGPRRAGPYDPASLHDVCALAVDPAGKFIWMVYPHEDPRRIIKFGTDGRHLQDYLGNTHYGGGGILDPHDKSRLWYKDVLFNLDWEKGTSRVQALVSLDYWEASPWGACFRPDWFPIPVNERLYLAAPGGRMASVYLYDAKRMTVRMAAAFGAAAGFPHLTSDAVLTHLAGKSLGQFDFIWTDRNGDGAVQVPEIAFTPRVSDDGGLGPFDRELTVLGRNRRYAVREFLADGTPVYAVEPLKFTATLRLDNGNYWHFAEGCNEVLSAAGERIWSYKAKQGMDGLKVYPWSPGVADLQFGLSGHATAHAGDLGEFVVVHANNGQMNVWTADGFLASHITYHTRDPRARGWPAEHARGTRLDGLTLGQEHFHSYFCKAEQDNTYYIVAGGTHISLVEVRGFEKFARTEGTFEVTAAMLEQTRAWDAERVRRRSFARPLVFDAAYARSPGADDAQPVEVPGLGSFRLAYDAANLYLKWEWKEDQIGRLANAGTDFRRLFKTGAAADFLLGADPRADPDRHQPVAGDLRVVLAPVGKRAVAVLYRPVAPGAPAAAAWTVSTPGGGTTAFDEVRLMETARVEYQPETPWAKAWLTAALPLKELGLAFNGEMLLRMDWGILTTRDGFSTSGRRYWANQVAVGTSDEPTEARLMPNLWGMLRVTPPRDTFDLGAPPAAGDTGDLGDALEELVK